MTKFFILLFIFFLSHLKIELFAEDFHMLNNKNIKSFIKEMVFIIKEHSEYATAHPKNLENIIRHLKHTCHALDPSLVKERPMPSPEIGLYKAIKIYLRNNKADTHYIFIESSTSKFAKLCNDNLYSGNNDILLSIAEDINNEFTIFYKKL